MWKTTCLAGLMIAGLTACGGNDSVKEPPPYYHAEEGQPVVEPDKASGALKIPDANQPLGDYNPKLKEPPVIVDVPEKIEEDD